MEELATMDLSKDRTLKKKKVVSEENVKNLKNLENLTFSEEKVFLKTLKT